jgi:nanoRNase/pAp phosphatase (c-di-AMP/oligoRNAs hydrolase)
MKEKLLRILEKTRSWKLILHNNPDPDAIASAFGFSYLLSKIGKRSKIFFNGIIGRTENKEMVKRLKIPLNPIDSVKFSKDSNIAMFDCQPGAGNQPLPKNIIPKIVIDHHKLRKESKKATLADIREGIGSSSSIVASYFQLFDIEPNSRVATAFFYGLKTDTFNFTRDFTKFDLEILNFIMPFTSMKLIGKIENPPINKDYFKKLCFAYHNALLFDKAIVINMEKVSYPDISAEIADLTVRMKGIKWVIVFSFFNNSIYFSIRTKSTQKIAGKLAVTIVKGLGSGGGHENSAGGMVKLNDYSEYENCKDMLLKRFLKKLKISTKEGVEFIPNA